MTTGQDVQEENACLFFSPKLGETILPCDYLGKRENGHCTSCPRYKQLTELARPLAEPDHRDPQYA